MNKTQRNLKLSVLTFLVIAFTTTLQSQKVGGFFDKLYEFEFPKNPLPSGVIYYKMSNDLKNGKITTRNDADEVIELSVFNLKRPTYSSEYKRYNKVLSVLKEFNKASSNINNTVYYNLTSSDIELTYRDTENDTIHEVYAKFRAIYTATFKEELLSSDTLAIDEKVGEIYSEEYGKEFLKIAAGLSNDLALDANDKIMVRAHNAYMSFAREAQMGYYVDNVAFFKMRQTKKLANGESAENVTERLRGLHSIDDGIKSQGNRNKEIKDLISNFEAFINSEDYKSFESYRVFVHGNLGSLYCLLEDYETSLKNYGLAHAADPKEKMISYYNNGKRNALRQQERKAIAFKVNNLLREGFSERYDILYNSVE